MNALLESLPMKVKQKLQRKPLPSWVEPMLATLTHDYFSDPDWIFERKLDGQRCLLFKEGDRLSMLPRNQKEQNDRYPEIANALQALSVNLILDCELVTFDSKITSFSKLQSRMHVKKPNKRLMKEVPIYAYLFDLLYLDGYDLSQLPLRERKKLLRKALHFKDPLRFLPHQNEQGEKLLKQACDKGWEGLIAKQAQSTYSHSRSSNWLKFKCKQEQEFVIGGYTQPRGERIGFGALLLGYYNNVGCLQYAGRVGTGFDDELLASLHQRMKKLQRKRSPFEDFDGSIESVSWTAPKLVAEVAFTEWTSSGKLRHPRFLGLRTDKEAREVMREDQRPV